MLSTLRNTSLQVKRLPVVLENVVRQQSSDNHGGAPIGVPTKMTASEAFVETLVAQGVTHVFGIACSAITDVLNLFPKAGIRFVSAQHEQNATHMSDGYARASGRHGVCIGENGPGRNIIFLLKLFIYILNIITVY